MPDKPLDSVLLSARLASLEHQVAWLKTSIGVAVGLVVLAFSFTPALGQIKSAARSAEERLRFRQAVSISGWEWGLLHAQVTAFEYRLRDYNEVGVPKFSYNSPKNRIEAHIWLRPEFVQHNTLDTIRKKLEEAAISAVNDVTVTFPDGIVERGSVFVEFHSWRAEDPWFYTVASYQNGKLSLH